MNDNMHFMAKYFGGFLFAAALVIASSCGEKGGMIVIKNDAEQEQLFYFKAEGKDAKSLIVSAGKENFVEFDYNADFLILPGKKTVSLNGGNTVVLTWNGNDLTE